MSKLTSNQKEFEKQIRKLNRLITKVENEGMTFITRPVVPVKPKRITKKFLTDLSKEISLPKIREYASEEPFETQQVSEVDITKARKHRKPQTFKPLTGRQITFDIDDNDSSTRFRQSSTPKVYLTPEQLTKIRKQSAKKAQKTIAQKMKDDPEYARRIRMARYKALEKARETMKVRLETDEQYAEHMREIWSENLSKARQVKKLKNEELVRNAKKLLDDLKQRQKERERQEQAQEPPKKETPTPKETSTPPEDKIKNWVDEVENAEGYHPAQLSDTIIANCLDILTRGTLEGNVIPSGHAKRILEAQIEIEGKEKLAERLEDVPDDVITMCQIIAFSSDQGLVQDNLYQFISILQQDKLDWSSIPHYDGDRHWIVPSSKTNPHSVDIFNSIYGTEEK